MSGRTYRGIMGVLERAAARQREVDANNAAIRSAWRDQMIYGQGTLRKVGDDVEHVPFAEALELELVPLHESMPGQYVAAFDERRWESE